MKFDKLGEELKAIEKANEGILPTQVPVIIRLDGKAFHTYTKKAEKPFSVPIHIGMIAAASALCKEIQNARFAYTQSDEISILIYEPADKSQCWFANKIQKMVSVASSICTTEFNDWNLALGKAHFDARAFSIPKDRVADYFKWRQEDAIRNSISMLAQANFSHRKLHKKNRRDMQDMLQLKGIEWKDLDDWKKNGSAVVKQWREKEGPNGEKVQRSFWASLEKCPNFDACTIMCPTQFGPPEGEPECGFIKKHLEQEITCGI